MSLYHAQTVACPACGTARTADIFYSINADRRPDLRAEVIDRTFQTQACGSCGASFRIDPDFNYLDAARGQWIAVHPFTQLRQWDAVTRSDQAIFDKSYGPAAAPSAHEIGETLAARVTFGWAGFREKIMIRDAGLDDVEVELLKIAILRTQPSSPLSQRIELRLVDSLDGELILCWLDAVADSVQETLVVPMDAYDRIAAEPDDWAALRADMKASAFVDMQRLMI